MSYKKLTHIELFETFAPGIGGILIAIIAAGLAYWSGDTVMKMLYCSFIGLVGFGCILLSAGLFGSALWRWRLFNNPEILEKELSKYFQEVKKHHLSEVCREDGNCLKTGFHALFEFSGQTTAEDSAVPIQASLQLTLNNMMGRCSQMDHGLNEFNRLMSPIISVAGRASSSEESMSRWIMTIQQAVLKASAEVQNNAAFNKVRISFKAVGSADQPDTGTAANAS